jgi:hypothetical protein
MLEIWCRTLRIRPGRWLTALGGITGFLSMIFVPLVITARTTSVDVLALTGISATLFAFVVASRRLQRDTTLKIDPKQIEDAWSSDSKLVLHLKSGSVVEAEPGHRTPDDILAELGLTLDQRALSAPLRGVLGSFTRGLLAFLGAWVAATFLTLPLHSPLLMVVSSLALAIVTSWLVVRTLRPRITVGLDGLRVTGVLRPMFVSYAHVQNVRIATYEHGDQQFVGSMVVVDTDGAPLVLPLIGQSNEQVQALVDRIKRGRERYAAEAARALDVLERAGRSTREWLEALRKLPAAGGFRAAALDSIDLQQVVSDPKVPLERRIGAALALRDDPEARKRVRIAAEQSAEPRVRVALEAAAADDIDESEIERALKN